MKNWDDAAGDVLERFAPEVIVLDFDGTLIKEHTLTSWVRFILLRTKLDFGRKLVFLTSSVFRGVVSILFSPRASLAEWAVKVAFENFKGIEIRTVDSLMHDRDRKGKLAINLNQTVITALAEFLADAGMSPGIEIHSQGSSTHAIRSFLKRRDVRCRLQRAGIRPDGIVIVANELEVDRNGVCTGHLTGKRLTKFSRAANIPANALFIGDDKDEAVLRKTGRTAVRFINWKKQAVRHPGP